MLNLPGVEVAFARRVDKWRRIGLPPRLAGGEGLALKGEKVELTRARNDRAAVMIRKTAGAGEAGWVRSVSGTLQVCLPEELMGMVGLKPGSWVYVMKGSDGRSLRLVPVESVQVVTRRWTAAPMASARGHDDPMGNSAAGGTW